MTKKDYELIAKAIKVAFDANYCAEPLHDSGVLTAALKLSDALAADNPRFAPNFFLHACGFKASGDSRKLIWSVDGAR